MSGFESCAKDDQGLDNTKFEISASGIFAAKCIFRADLSYQF